MTAALRFRSAERGGRAHEAAPRPVGGFVTGIAAVLALAAALAACARDAEPTTFAVPRAAAAEIRMTCWPGPGIGILASGCARPPPRLAGGQ